MLATLSYNPRNRLAQRTLDYILSLGVFRLEDKDLHHKDSVITDNKQQFANDFRTAMKHAKEFRDGNMQFSSIDSLLGEL